jgi:hypothetical protein
MPTIPLLPFAAAAGFPWQNLVWVLAGITALLFAVAGAGRWLAATHPDPVSRSRRAPTDPAARATSPDLGPETKAAIAAAVAATFGPSASVSAVVLPPVKPASVENLMLTWSLEGRRQIYTSHKVR